MKNRLELKCFSNELQYSVQKKVLLEGDRYKNGGTQSEIIGDANLLFENETSLKVRRADFLFDGKRFCENPVDQCFVKAAEVLNDLDLTLSEDGVLKSIRNREEILRKWSYCKIYLDRFFVSEDSLVKEKMDEYILKFDRVVKDDELFLSGVKRDLFYTVFFRGYYQDFGEGKCLFQNSLWNSLFGPAKVVVSEEWVLSNVSGVRRIQMNGQLNRDESDMKSIFQYLGPEEDCDSVSVSLNGESLFDEHGIPLRIDFKLEAQTSSDYNKQISVCIKKK